jgi:predicted  nucleic acid-binding Zn-ribbon protein
VAHLTPELLTTRIEQLRRELDAGQQRRAELQAQLQDLEATMLRISGAVQVLQELLEAEAAPG